MCVTGQSKCDVPSHIISQINYFFLGADVIIVSVRVISFVGLVEIVCRLYDLMGQFWLVDSNSADEKC